MTRDELIVHHQDWTKRLVSFFYSAHKHSHHALEYDDLYGYALEALVKVAGRYQSNHKNEAKFTTYARPRIFGSMIDGIRKEGTRSRYWMAENKRHSQAEESLIAKGLPVTAETMAEELGYDIELYHDKRYLTKLSTLTIYLDDTNADHYLEAQEQVAYRYRDTFPNGEELLLEQESMDNILRHTDKLTSQEIDVIELIYTHENTTREAAKLLKLSESRVSQLHTSAIKMLKKKAKK